MDIIFTRLPIPGCIDGFWIDPLPSLAILCKAPYWSTKRPNLLISNYWIHTKKRWVVKESDWSALFYIFFWVHTQRQGSQQTTKVPLIKGLGTSRRDFPSLGTCSSESNVDRAFVQDRHFIDACKLSHYDFLRLYFSFPVLQSNSFSVFFKYLL